MDYRTFLVQLDIEEPNANRLKVAKALADRFDARLIGFAAASFRPIVSMEGYTAVTIEIFEEEQRKIEAHLERLKAEFKKYVGDRFAGWRSKLAPPTDLLVREARSADLIICASPQGASTGDVYQTVDLGALVLEAGRPLLVVANDRETLAAERVVVAWKDTREARRAVLDALPLLAKAKDVLVAAVAEPSGANDRVRLDDVVRFLERHGSPARAELIEPNEGDATGALLSAAAERLGADLIVSGAYGHGRLREWIFGGVTRSLLDNNAIHRLLSN